MPVEPREVIAASISEPATVADARFHTSSHTPQHTTIPESEVTFATAQPDRSMAPASMTAAPISQDPPAKPAEPSAYHDNEPDLPRLLAPILPGALPLQARCPRHPQTQLFLDTQGRVHLAAMSGPEPGDLPAAVVSLMETRQWVHEHFELLQLTQRQCRFDITQPPQLHLLTPQAPWLLA
ncbi:MAG: hypothetical protein HC898_07880 [Phycisphaerales bacterium]|nr:hypothetical protein [Phycisphaerales bacterium]